MNEKTEQTPGPTDDSKTPPRKVIQNRSPRVGPFLISDITLMKFYGIAMLGETACIVCPSEEICEKTRARMMKLAGVDKLPDTLTVITGDSLNAMQGPEPTYVTTDEANYFEEDVIAMTTDNPVDKLIATIRADKYAEGTYPLSHRMEGHNDAMSRAANIIEENRAALEAGFQSTKYPIIPQLKILDGHIKAWAKQYQIHASDGDLCDLAAILNDALHAVLNATPHCPLCGGTGKPPGPGHDVEEFYQDDGRECGPPVQQPSAPAGDMDTDDILNRYRYAATEFEKTKNSVIDRVRFEAVMNSVAGELRFAVTALQAKADAKPTGDVGELLESVRIAYVDNVDPPNGINDYADLRDAVTAIQRDCEDESTMIQKLLPALEAAIHATPSGDNRNALCDLNIEARALLERLKGVRHETQNV